MYCLDLITSDVSNTSYYLEVENGALLRDVTRSWKMILGDHAKSWKSHPCHWYSLSTPNTKI